MTDGDLREQIRKAQADRSPVARLGRLVGKVLNLAFILAMLIVIPALLGTLFIPGYADKFGLMLRWMYGVPLVGGLIAYAFIMYYMISRTLKP